MTDTAIKVEHLSKRYRIGLQEEIHDTLGGALQDFITSPIRNLRRLRRLTSFDDNPGPRSSVPGPDSPSPVSGPPPPVEPKDVIWALRDVSFEVKEGEVVGIIGDMVKCSRKAC